MSELMMTAVDERVEVAPGVALRVRQWPAAGRPFVLVHGLASNARLWDGVGPFLAGRGFAGYAVDLRGHGESDQPADGYDTATAAADVAALVARLGLAEPVLAGQSWGGNVVLELAASRPALPHAVALLDGGWIHLGDAFPTWEQCWAALAPPVLRAVRPEDLRAMLQQWHPDWPETGIEGTMGNFEVLPDGTARNRLSRDRHAAILRSLWQHRPRELYTKVTAPTLLMPAGRPDGERAGQVTEAAAALAHGTIRWYEGADHDLHAQHPARVAADLADLA